MVPTPQNTSVLAYSRSTLLGTLFFLLQIFMFQITNPESSLRTIVPAAEAAEAQSPHTISATTSVQRPTIQIPEEKSPPRNPPPDTFQVPPEPQAPPPAPPSLPLKNGVSVWMDINDWGEALQSMSAHAGQIAEVNAAWYIALPDGTVAPRAGTEVNDPRLVRIARTHGILIRPLIMNLAGPNFDADIAMEIFANPEVRKKTIANLKDLVAANSYDGLDLDFEGLVGTEVHELAAFVEELAFALHSIDATLTVSIQAFPDDTLLPAWSRIGIAADEVKLMAYGQRHKTPQAVVNPEQMRTHIERALKAIPAEKLRLALPIYCFSWSGTKVGSGTWQQLLQPALATAKRDKKTQASWFEEKGKTVWCEDGKSIQMKTEIARALGVNKFALWRLGGEDPSLWENKW